MRKIIFACPWEKDKNNSWSGTHMGIYWNMCKQYKVINIDTGYYNSSSVLLKICHYYDRILSKFRKYEDMGMLRQRVANKVYKKLINNLDCPILQFEECPIENGNVNKYIYQDLNVGYVKKMFELDKKLFEISGYRKISSKYLYKREKQQREYYNTCNKIFTMGKWLEKELVEQYGLPKEKVIHVGGGCNIDTTLIDNTNRIGNKILFVGKDFERKNGLLVVEAFKIAKLTNSNLELYIAGPEEIEFNDPSIHFLGLLSFSELVKYFNICDIFCMPSKFEAYGLVFVEALIFGLPCIGRNAYEMPYFIEDGETGFLLQKEDPKELSELMLKLIDSERIKKNVLSKRDWYIKKYSWENVVERITSEINKQWL